MTVRDSSPDNQRIDVVIPVYNGERFILDALRSVDSQTCLPAKIIVVDDGSTDGTWQLVTEYRGEVPIQYVRQENRGLSAARNAGIAQCTSEFVAFLDADDEWFPEKLERQVARFRDSELPHLGLVYANCCMIGEDGERDDEAPAAVAPYLRGQVFGELLACNVITGSGSSVLIRRRCFDDAGLFDERLHAFEDWDMWLRITRSFAIDFVVDPLVKIRRHGQNMQGKELFMFENSLKFYDKWCQLIDGSCSNYLQWRDSVIHKIIEHLPDLRFMKMTRQQLSAATKHIMFRSTFGSLELFLLLQSKAVAGRMARYCLGMSR